MSAVCLCHECKSPLSAPASIERGLCSRCLRILGAVPTRKPGGEHDEALCICGRCVDWRRECADDWRADRNESEGWA